MAGAGYSFDHHRRCRRDPTLAGHEPLEAASLPIIGPLYHADVWWVALLNEVLGLVVLGGMILVIYRRYVQKDPQLRTIPADSIVITFLTLIAFSGFPAETFRLLADYTTPAGSLCSQPDPCCPRTNFRLFCTIVWGPQWGFAGYLSQPSVSEHCGSAPRFGTCSTTSSFWLHFVIVTALLFLLPFSRFFHVIMSPVIVAYNTVAEQEAHDERLRHRRKMPHIAAGPQAPAA